MTAHEILMGTYLEELRLKYQREFKFHPSRRWKFDFAIPSKSLAIEIEGGIWSRGRHSRGAGYQSDLDKYNEAAVLGWTVLRFSVADVTGKYWKNDKGIAIPTAKLTIARWLGKQ